MNSQLNAYKQNQINTASSEKLVLMLYDGAGKFIKQAIKAMENCDIQTANNNLLRSQDIISELMANLNYEAGPIAQQYYTLYEYMHYRLVQANLKKDIPDAKEVLEMIGELRSAWAQIIESGQSDENDNLVKNIAI